MNPNVVYDLMCRYCSMKSTNDTSVTRPLLREFTIRAHKILTVFFDIRICENEHLYLVCRKCGNVVHNTITHVFRCIHEIDNIPVAIEIKINGIVTHELCLDLITFVKRLPQLLCIKLDFASLIDTATDNEICFPFDDKIYRRHIDSGFYPELMRTANDKIVQCIACDMYYDSFPSFDESAKHFSECVSQRSITE